MALPFLVRRNLHPQLPAGLVFTSGKSRTSPPGIRIAGMPAEPEKHWERIYRTRAPTEVSWFQAEPRLSLDLIRRAAPDLGEPIIDVGGGTSTLVDRLLEAGYRAV